MTKKGLRFKEDVSDESSDPSDILKSLESRMMGCLSLINAVEFLDKLVKKAQILKDLFDIHFRDNLGYTLLGNAVKLRSMSVIEYLIEKQNFVVDEELIIAVDLDYTAAVGYLLQHNPDLANRPVLTGTVCRPGFSPVMVASLNENEAMLKFLFSRGAQALEIPQYNPRESRNIIRFDAIYQMMLALSKPMYLCIMNEDPVMVAFKISERCKQIASDLTVAKKDMLAISESCENFAASFISNVENFEELQLLMDQMTTDDERVVVPGEPWERLKYALSSNHQRFVANGSVQRLIKRKFFEGPFALKDFESAHFMKKVLYICTLIVLTPFWIFFFMCVPVSRSPTGKFIKSWLEMPMMRFIVQLVLYSMLVLMVASSGPHYSQFNLQELQLFADYRLCYEALEDKNATCLSFLPLTDAENESLSQNLSETEKEEIFLEIVIERGDSFFADTFTNSTYVYLVDAYIMLWTIGNSYQELQNILMDGFSSYSSDWVNVLNMLLNFSFITGISVRYTYMIEQSGYSKPSVGSNYFAHPLEITDTLRSLGLFFLIFKLYKSLRISALVGQPQHLLGVAFVASFNFLLTFFTAIVAFSASMNGIIHSTYFQYLKSCLSGNDSLVSVPCASRLIFDRGDTYSDASQEEMENYQTFSKVFADFFFAMFQSRTRIQFNFPVYENPQEWILSVMYTMFAFVMLVVRLNILISLIIFAVLDGCKYEEGIYKFRRTNLLFMFIAGRDPLPPPFNVLPSVNLIAARLNSKGFKGMNVLTENELQTVVAMRELIQKLKGTFLRKYRKLNRETSVSATDLENLKSNIVSQCDSLIKGVADIQRKTKELLDRGISQRSNDSDGIQNEIEANVFMKRYKNKGKQLIGNQSLFKR